MSVLDNCLVFLHKRVAIPQRTKMECVYRRMIKGYAYKMAFPHKIVLADARCESHYVRCVERVA